MNFQQAIASGFKNYATFSGRAARSEYWFWSLFVLLVSAVTAVIDVAVFNVDTSDPTALSPLNAICSILLLVPGLAVSARRLHDVNRSGWWMLIWLTIIGLIPLLIWACTKGTDGDNRFGPDPLAS